MADFSDFTPDVPAGQPSAKAGQISILQDELAKTRAGLAAETDPDKVRRLQGDYAALQRELGTHGVQIPAYAKSDFSDFTPEHAQAQPAAPSAPVSDDAPSYSQWFGKSKWDPRNPYGYLADTLGNGSSKTSAVVQGFAHGATLGFDNQIDSRNIQGNQQAMEAHPGYYLTGAVAGSAPAFMTAAGGARALLPNAGRIVQAATGAGAVGAVQGAAAPADSTQERLANMTINAGVNATTAGLFAGGGQLISTAVRSNVANALTGQIDRVGKAVNSATGGKADFSDLFGATREQLRAIAAKIAGGENLTAAESTAAGKLLDAAKQAAPGVASQVGNSATGAGLAGAGTVGYNALNDKPLMTNVPTAMGVGAALPILGRGLVQMGQGVAGGNLPGVTSGAVRMVSDAPVIGPAIQRAFAGVPQTGAIGAVTNSGVGAFGGDVASGTGTIARTALPPLGGQVSNQATTAATQQMFHTYDDYLKAYDAEPDPQKRIQMGKNYEAQVKAGTVDLSDFTPDQGR